MNLIYSCIFFNKDYILLFKLLLESYIKYNTYYTKYLIITNNEFKLEIEDALNELNIDYDIWCLNINSILGACCSRLLIFDYPKIYKYTKILYLDTDIIITNNLTELINYNLDTKLYVFNENKKINDWGHGKILFDKENIKINNIEVFSTCVLLFLNCNEIKSLFNNINLLIDKYFPNKFDYNFQSSYDQDFIIYQCVIENNYDNKLITKHIHNNSNILEQDMILNHFCIPCGDSNGKYERMKQFMIYVNNIRIPNIKKNNIKVKKNKETLNIYDDVWTCSDEMREDIRLFFYNKKDYNIIELGSHKGYTTKVLSTFFNKVYAIDNNEKFILENKNFNKENTNIEYINFDLYNDNWNILPKDVNIVFIDACHDYKSCKSDILNSIIYFKDLKYIILDDYGVWDGVKLIINELLLNNTLHFETYIGLNDIPGLDGILRDSSEGIICTVLNNLKIIS